MRQPRSPGVIRLELLVRADVAAERDGVGVRDTEKGKVEKKKKEQKQRRPDKQRREREREKMRGVKNRKREVVTERRSERAGECELNDL